MSETVSLAPQPDAETPKDLALLAAELESFPATAALSPEAESEQTETGARLGRIATAGQSLRNGVQGTKQKLSETRQGKLKELEAGDEFYEALGHVSVEAAYAEPVDPIRAITKPQNRYQRRHAEKLAMKVQEHGHKMETAKWREDFYKGTVYHAEYDKKASRLAYKQAKQSLQADLAAGNIDTATYAKGMSTLSKDTMVVKPDKAMRKHREELRSSATKLEKTAHPRRVQAVRGARKRINKALSGNSASTVDDTAVMARLEADVTEPTELTLSPAAEVLDATTPTIPETRELTPLEQLQKLRAEGKLPAPTPKTAEPAVKLPEVTSTPEPATNDVLTIAQGILAQVEQAKAREPNLNKDDLVLELLEKALVNPEGTPDSDISDKGVQILEAIEKLEAEAKADAEPESVEQKEVAPASAELLDEASVQRMAETVYIGAQDKVHLQIDAEDRQRRADGKPKLTKEEKAEYWKNELDIREQLLGDLSPENKSLVDKQISELIKTDKAAYRAGEEKLRDKRRRERREQQAAERKAQPASTSQRGNETVQQRARREREEKAKQKIADGQRTFSHPDIPS